MALRFSFTSLRLPALLLVAASAAAPTDADNTKGRARPFQWMTVENKGEGVVHRVVATGKWHNDVVGSQTHSVGSVLPGATAQSIGGARPATALTVRVCPVAGATVLGKPFSLQVVFLGRTNACGQPREIRYVRVLVGESGACAVGTAGFWDGGTESLLFDVGHPCKGDLLEASDTSARGLVPRPPPREEKIQKPDGSPFLKIRLRNKSKKNVTMARAMFNTNREHSVSYEAAAATGSALGCYSTGHVTSSPPGDPDFDEASEATFELKFDGLDVIKWTVNLGTALIYRADFDAVGDGGNTAYAAKLCVYRYPQGNETKEQLYCEKVLSPGGTAACAP